MNYLRAAALGAPQAGVTRLVKSIQHLSHAPQGDRLSSILDTFPAMLAATVKV